MEIKLPSHSQLEAMMKYYRPKPIRPDFELNSSSNHFVVSDVSKDGVCYGSTGNNILKSTDYGKTTTNLGTIPYTTTTPLIAWVLKMGNGTLAIGARNRDLNVSEIWLSDKNEANFSKVFTFETPGAYPSSTFGYSKFRNILLVNEYGADKSFPNNPRRCYMSIDYGRTWKTILTLPNAEGVHPHDIQYDPYEDIIWIVSGDGLEHRRVWFSADRGNTWEEIIPPKQYTNISVLPNCILFGTDTALEVGFYRLNRPKGGFRTAAEFNIEKAYLQTDSHPQMPIACKSHSDFVNGIVYSSFYETHPYYTIPSTIYATKDGINFFIVWQSEQDTVVNTGGSGVLAIAGADNENLIAYVRMNIGDKSNHTLKLKLPEWVM